jgi:hypothetical protein
MIDDYSNDEPEETHLEIRPNFDGSGVTEIEKMDSDGNWGPDDGKPGWAFSGVFVGRRGGEMGLAFYSKCYCGSDDCPTYLASKYTAKRFGSSNGVPVKENGHFNADWKLYDR